LVVSCLRLSSFFSFNATSTTEIYTLSLHDALPIYILEFYHMLQSTSIKVEVDIPEDNLYILGNEDALNRILHNLISNAIRYGSEDRKSTRLNSSHVKISYAVFCLKKKKKTKHKTKK